MPRSAARALAAALVAVALHAAAARHVAHADGGPGNALVVIDPTDPDSLYLGHLYVDRRGIPASNVLYLPPAAADYASWTAFQRHAVTGTLAARGLGHVDHIVLAPSRRFFLPLDPSRVATGCVVVSRMSLSSAFTFLPEADEVLGGKLNDQDLNRYHGDWRRPADAVAFDSRTRWYNGKPATGGGARRYFAGALLGYLGERGNTVDEIAALIERSAAADGTHPDGTFYFMNVAGEVRNYRSADFPSVMKAITDMGGKALTLDGLVPHAHHDALGILTGTTHPGIVGADVTLLPGSFADHLTSFAATYDDGSQEKMSSWITAGASATLGTVEEPCTGGKFPDAALHAFYYAGLPLGEAILRSVQWSAFQSLVVGDPLTRPFTHIPAVTVAGLPSGATPVAGTIDLTARATTTAPGGTIAGYTLYVDGIAVAEAADGRFAWGTTTLADGWHDVRVTAVDGSPVRAMGEWRGEVEVANRARVIELAADVETTAEPRGVSRVNLSVTGPGERPAEVRVLQNSRVVYVNDGFFQNNELPAPLLGAGRTRLRAVAVYDDGAAVASHAFTLDIRPSDVALPADGPPTRGAPTAVGYTIDARPGRPQLVDLVAWDASGAPDEIVVDTPPAQAELRRVPGALLLLPRPDATGTDTFTYHATNAGLGTSGPAEMTIRYCPAAAPDRPVAPGLPDPCRRWRAPGDRTVAYLPWMFRVPVGGGHAGTP